MQARSYKSVAECDLKSPTDVSRVELAAPGCPGASAGAPIRALLLLPAPADIDAKTLYKGPRGFASVAPADAVAKAVVGEESLKFAELAATVEHYKAAAAALEGRHER